MPRHDCAHRMGRGLSCRDTIVHSGWDGGYHAETRSCTLDGMGVTMLRHDRAHRMERGLPYGDTEPTNSSIII
jgi:hypothetical protein